MSKRLNLALLPLVLTLAHAAGSAATVHTPASFRLRAASAPLREATNERQQDGLNGPVRRVRTETAKITVKNGKPVEGARQVLETTTYDQKGNRVDNAYFLAAGGSLTGKEVYKYDARGNIVEMTLHNDDGTLLAKEIYTYEFDSVGNWVKMTTSVAVMEGGTVSFEPSEVTYRMISYFLDESMLAKMQPASAQSPAPAAAAPVAASAQPQPAASNAQANTAAAQPKPSPAATSTAAQQPAKEAAPRNATLLVASLDKGAAPAPTLGAASNQAAAAAAGGPAVKAEDDAPAPAVPFRSGPLRPLSGGILNGKAVSLPMPSYPEAAKRARVAGVVEVEVVIDINGKVISAKALRGPGLLQQAAEMSARQARFTPTLLSGQPMKVVGVITYNFTLQQ